MRGLERSANILLMSVREDGIHPGSATVPVASVGVPPTDPGVWTFFGDALVEPVDASKSFLPEVGSRIAHPFKGGMVEQQSKSRRDG
jgi:hypothetical protein